MGNIRSDFQPLPFELNRFLEFAKIFEENNQKRWGHLKNQEDFHKVYDLSGEYKEAFENIYAIGRDLSVAMAHLLRFFNYPEYCPTLTHFLNLPAFTSEWIAKITDLEEMSSHAKQKAKDLGDRAPWAIGEMIELFDDQITLLIEIKRCLDTLRQSELYLREQNVIHIPTYMQILNVINKVGRNFERLPATYQGKDEESLRDHILSVLDCFPDFCALGEVFNKNGKTDIFCSRSDDQVELIAECKFWHGERAFLEAIDQLLSYTTWRNDKLAIIMFVPNVDINKAIDTAKQSIQYHQNYVRLLCDHDRAWSNYEFCKDGSKFELALMLYHLPK